MEAGQAIFRDQEAAVHRREEQEEMERRQAEAELSSEVAEDDRLGAQWADSAGT
jgi:hypothetical protein